MATARVTIRATTEMKLETLIEIPDGVEVDPALRDDIVDQIKSLVDGDDYSAVLGTWKTTASELTASDKPPQRAVRFKLVDGVVRFTNPKHEE
jgi:hypothetical protein